MTAPVIAFLSQETRCHSRGRFEEEARALGLATKWLSPDGFDLLVDAEKPRVYYRSRPFAAPAAFV